MRSVSACFGSLSGLYYASRITPNRADCSGKLVSRSNWPSAEDMGGFGSSFCADPHAALGIAQGEYGEHRGLTRKGGPGPPLPQRFNTLKRCGSTILINYAITDNML